MNRKLLIFSILAVFSLIVLTIVGCSESKSADEESTGGVSSDKQEEVVITYWDWTDYIKEEGSPGLEMIKEFNEKHKGKIRVEPKFIVGDEYSTAMQAAISSDELPDLFAKHGSLPIRIAVEQKLIRPLDDIVSEDWKNQFYEGTFAEGINMIDGKTYTFPIAGPQLMDMLYYNKDVMKNAGLDPEKPPKTWGELRSMAKQVTEKGNGDVYGIIFGGGMDKLVLRVVQGFAEGISPLEGVPFNYKTGKYSFDTKPWIDSVKFMVDLKKDGSILPSSYSLPHAEAGVLFGKGKAAFILDARWRMWQIKRDTPNANFGVTYTPTLDGAKPIYGYNLDEAGIAVSANTKHPDEVGIFIEEGLGSRAFYDRYFKGAVALTPLPDVNQDVDNYSYPQMKDWVKLHEDVLVTAPNPVIRNSQVSKLYEEIGNLGQSKIKPKSNEVILSLIMEAETDIEGTLKKYNDKLNKGLAEGINKVSSEGAEVDIDDFIFPNWQPGKAYTNEDYKELK